MPNEQTREEIARMIDEAERLIERRKHLQRAEREQFDYLSYYERHAPHTLTDDERTRLAELRALADEAADA